MLDSGAGLAGETYRFATRLVYRRPSMKHSDHGIVKNEKAEDQPADKERARTAHRSDPDNSASHEATRDPERVDAENTAGSRGLGSRTDKRR